LGLDFALLLASIGGPTQATPAFLATPLLLKVTITRE
jgi:hypothetical protein